MPPRKKAVPANADASTTPDPLTTRAVRSSARLASQGTAAVAKSDSTTDGTTSSKPASKAKTKAASKATKPASNARPKRTKADAGDGEEDAPASKKPKTTSIQEEEEEEDMDVDTQCDKKEDKKMVCNIFTMPAVHKLTSRSR